jgi:hypothetical protein
MIPAKSGNQYLDLYTTNADKLTGTTLVEQTALHLKLPGGVEDHCDIRRIPISFGIDPQRSVATHTVMAN